MAIDTIKSTAVLDGTIATADIADDAVTSAKLDTNISVDGNLGLGTSVSTRKLNVNAGSYGHILLDTANAAHGLQILGQANAQANSGFDIQYAASTGLKVRTLAVQPLSLQTSASAGSPSDRLHIHTNGIVSIPQGIELGSGVDATAANVLDDYEYGVFDPDLACSGTNFSSRTINSRAGYYEKVGNAVSTYIYFDLSAFTLGSGSGNMKITGLPFSASTARAASGGGGACAFHGVNVGSTVFNAMAYAVGSEVLFLVSRDQASWVNIQIGDIHSGTIFAVWFQLNYYVD